MLFIASVVVFFISILTYLVYVWNNGFYDVLTLILRTLGLLLYKVMDCNSAYLANIGLDVLDSNFYKGKPTLKTNIPHRRDYEMQDKISDNISRFAMVMCNYSDETAAVYIFRSVGEIIYGCLQIMAPVDDMKYEPIFIAFANFMDAKVVADMIPVKTKWPLYLAGGALQIFREYILHAPHLHPRYN